MKLPSGRLLRSRVVEDPRTALIGALDREVTGYGSFDPQGSLLLDEAGTGVITFADGVPVIAYHTGTERGGPAALADLAANGPYRFELFGLSPAALAAVHDRDAFRVPPGMPAERLAGDQSLAERTRDVAARSAVEFTPATGEPSTDTGDDAVGAVEAFLEDEAKIEGIRKRARAEAEARAEEWGFEV